MSTDLNEQEQQDLQQEKHKARQAKKKAIVDERIAKATEERGVLILLKGNVKDWRLEEVIKSIADSGTKVVVQAPH